MSILGLVHSRNWFSRIGLSRIGPSTVFGIPELVEGFFRSSSWSGTIEKLVCRQFFHVQSLVSIILDVNIYLQTNSMTSLCGFKFFLSFFRRAEYIREWQQADAQDHVSLVGNQEYQFWRQEVHHKNRREVNQQFHLLFQGVYVHFCTILAVFCGSGTIFSGSGSDLGKIRIRTIFSKFFK